MDAKRKRAANPENSSAAESKCLVAELPHDLITDILSRLPIKSLFNCKFVCKTWLCLISDPHFAKLHLSRSSMTFLLQNDYFFKEQLLIQIDEEVSSKSLEFDRMRFVSNRNLPDVDFEVINSCNGLVCLEGQYESLFHQMIYVCNPILREYITIPIVEEPIKYVEFVAFGFSSVSNQYKVLRTFSLDENGSSRCPAEAEVYTVGTGQWRSIGKDPFKCAFLNINASLHDTIHWLGDTTEGNGFICAFDFGLEQFKRFPLPLAPEKCHSMGKLWPSCLGVVNLGVIKGCLFITKGVCFSQGISSQGISEIWVMEEYGIKESWSKKFVVRHLQLDDYCFYEPLFFLSSGKILMLLECGDIVSYDPKLKSFQDTTLSQGMKFFIGVTAYSPSFVSLQDIAKGEEVKVLRG